MPPPLSFEYRDIREWRNSPIYRVVLHDVTTLDRFHLYLATGDSTYDVAPILRRDMYGCDRIAGWMFRASFVLLQNNIGLLLEQLDAYKARPMDAFLFLKPSVRVPHGRTVTIQLRAPVGVTWRIVKDQQGPAFSVELTKALTSLYQYAAEGGDATFWNQDQYLIPDPTLAPED